MVVTRAGSVEERKKKQQEKKDKELQDLEDAVGFTSVLRKISESVGFINNLFILINILTIFHKNMTSNYHRIIPSEMKVKPATRTGIPVRV